MGTIPINSIVTVNMAVAPTFPARAGFGTLLCVTKETGVLTLANRVREYAGVDGVSGDWGADSEVTKLANSYFSQSPKPTSFMVGIRFEEDQKAMLRGGVVADSELATFQAITDGTLKVSIDGVESDLTALNFSATSSMVDVATVIQTTLQAVATGGFTLATCVYDTNKFIIKSGTVGISSLISYGAEVGSGTDISSLTQLQQGQATKTNGIAGEKVSESLTALEEVNSTWYGFAYTKEVRDGVVINTESAVDGSALWAEARTKVYFTTTNDELAYDSTSTTDIAYLLSQKSLSRTLVVFSSKPAEYPEASIAGRAFSVDFTAGNPSITLKFKQLPGITVESLSYNQKTALDAKNCNALISVGGNIMLAEGVMSGGRFFDEVHGLDWLTNAIQTNVFGTLFTSNKVPYTDPGVQRLAQQVTKALAEGVDAGLLAPGVDSSGRLLPNGYLVNTVPVSQVNQSDKEARIYKGISFTALGAGAIHGVTVNGVFER